jgi:Mg-chelatase subunit ChlI
MSDNIVVYRNKITSLQKTMAIITQHDCFDEEDKQWVTEEINKANQALRELTSYESQVLTLQGILDKRVALIGQVQDEADLATHSSELFERFAAKQIDLARAVASQAIPPAILSGLPAHQSSSSQQQQQQQHQ